jgi:hypothetical protein
VGLDIYAGPVSRYASGGWSTIIEQAGAAAGMPVITVRPGESMEDLMRRALAEGGDAPIREIRMTDVKPRTQPIAEWKAGVLLSLGLNEEWDDRPDGEYYTDKPGWEGYGAVVLLAAYDEHPELAPGAKVKRLLGSRAVAAVAPGDFGEAEAYKAAAESPARYPTFLRAEWCLPISGGPPLFAAPTPGGKQVTMGRVSRLLEELQLLNERTLRLSAADMEKARRAEEPPDLASFESMAPFGLSIITATAEFAAAHRVAWIMDY